MTNTYNTLNPLGSTSAKDLSDNSSNFDEGMNSLSSSFYDRFMRRRETWAGMEKMVSDFLEAMGFEATHLVYVDGTPLTVLRPTQLIDRAGSVYKVKQPASFPVVLSGTWSADQLLLVDVGDAALRNTLLGPNGDNSIGTTNGFGVVSTVGARLDLVDNGTVYSDNPVYGGSVQAAVDAMGASTVLVMRGTINLSTHLKFMNKVNPVVVFAPGCRVIGARPFSFDSGLRGILDFYECSDPIVYRPRITGVNEVKVFAGTTPGFQADGDTGIEFIRCTGSRVIGDKVGKLDYFMGWGIVHVQGSDAVVKDLTIERCTQQSGISFAGVQKGFASGNSISNIGLYGIEVEGTNSDVTVRDNWIDDVHQGICFINAALSCRATGNRVGRAVYGMTANAVGTADSANSFDNNRTFDCLMHFQLINAHHLKVRGNESISSSGTPSAYIHQRAADFAVKIIDATSVLIQDSATSNVTNGSVHQYVAAGAKTVQSFGVVADPTYGSCTRVTYNEGTVGMVSGDPFRRFTDLQAANSRWMYAGSASGLSNIEVYDNIADVATNIGVDFAGVIDNWKSGNNKIRGVKYAYSAVDSTAMTNSSIGIAAGDCSPITALFLGAAQAKFFASVVGERHSFTTGKASENGFNVSTGSTAVKVKVLIYGSSAASAPVLVNMNATPIVSIPAAEFGTGGLVFRETIVNLSPGFFTFTVTGGGAMTISNASFEVNVAEM